MSQEPDGQAGMLKVTGSDGALEHTTPTPTTNKAIEKFLLRLSIISTRTLPIWKSSFFSTHDNTVATVPESKHSPQLQQIHHPLSHCHTSSPRSLLGPSGKTATNQESIDTNQSRKKIHENRQQTPIVRLESEVKSRREGLREKQKTKRKGTFSVCSSYT